MTLKAPKVLGKNAQADPEVSPFIKSLLKFKSYQITP
jgi:hypothetical protein